MTASWCWTAASATKQTCANGEKTLSRFETYRVLVGERVLRTHRRAAAPRRASSIDLLRSPTPRNQGELAWRLGLLLGGANLLLLAIPLSVSNPRRASNWSVLLALLAFVVYYNLINLCQAWVASGKLGMGTALALFHGGAFVVGDGVAVVARERQRPQLLAPPVGRAAGECRMKTVRRLFYKDIVSSVLFVAVAFLSLFFFIDFVDELGDVGTRLHRCCMRRRIRCLQVPGHLYELSPIAVLIGTIYALARLAQSSEYTILRTGGLGPGRALSLAGQPRADVRGADLRGRRLRRAVERARSHRLLAGAPRAARHWVARRLAQGPAQPADGRAKLLGQRRLGRQPMPTLAATSASSSSTPTAAC